MHEREFSQEVTNAAFNTELKKLFGVNEETPVVTPDSANQDILYGREPDARDHFNVGTREFGLELYRPNPEVDRKICVVAQHGYGGRGRDYSKLAEILNEKGITILSLDMHADGKDDFEKMSMRADEWANAGIQARTTSLLTNVALEKYIFVGQSSGGTGGVELLERSKKEHQYDGAILIGPTLVTVHPELVQSMDELAQRYTSENQDVMIDWKWLASLTQQMNDPKLNRAYQSHLATTPGFPYKAAREAIAIPKEKLIERLGQVDVPTFMVKGADDHEDEVSLLTASEVLEKVSNPNITLCPEIQNAGHQAHIEKPEEIAKLVEELDCKNRP